VDGRGLKRILGNFDFQWRPLYPSFPFIPLIPNKSALMRKYKPYMSSRMNVDWRSQKVT
jgi:hypothetical protein